MNAQQRAREIWKSVKNNPIPADFIAPVKNVDLRVIESLIDGDPEKDYAFIVSDSATAYGDIVVKQFIEYQSGLENWYVVPGYPYLNADKQIEWKVVRAKDW